MERSLAHRRVERWLDELGIAYESEVSAPPYQLDIYLSEWNLCIEVDGPSHGRLRERKRDQYLMDHYGIPTLRIKHNAPAEQAREAIIEFIERHANRNSDGPGRESVRDTAKRYDRTTIWTID